MGAAPIAFEGVWKKFERGEHHDSLRDLIPAAFARFGRKPPEVALSRQEFWALQDVSFAVHSGEALGVIGRNGAGKSTVLKLLNRILRPTRGSAVVRGRSGALIEVAAGFHPDLTGRENVYLQGTIMGMSRGDIARRFDAIVAFAGIEPFIDTPVKRYSSGMNARLGFSIAAHLEPEALLIDEVLAVGDRAFQEKCHAKMMQFRRDGVAIVFVSHHLPAVAQLCTRALLLDNGRVAREGTPAEVIAEYCGGTQATNTASEVSVSAMLRARGQFVASDGFAVEPGTRLCLDVTLDFHVDVQRALIGIVVWDLTRDLYVYGASSEFVGVPPVSAAAGETRSFSFAFDAHLTRGLYAIEVNVVDADRQAFLAVVRGIRHFSVVERVSYDGTANLYLAGREIIAPSLEGAPSAVAR